ncbi:uncharacterized protein T551_01396 [Pneumocystis jirovecii RU7]|uniref:OTU domain-containing protein n=1 Tax=Pneumocystis jirovecii (strain RU7) TaxID=1408657 RepID=A0A0W4ZSJ8_PNEJ7|nr:uncharacterized protein T551_01396 [Pneumocystis jirovecii RU7]KTW31324.1 hypothetical protein T551_01396 [Pneumocystis jirovecii RU7]
MTGKLIKNNNSKCFALKNSLDSSIEPDSPNIPRKSRQRSRMERRKKELERIRNEMASEEKSSLDMRKIEQESITATIEKMSYEEKDFFGLKNEQINPDGHCLYRAFSDQLAVRHGIHVSYIELRAIAASYIREHEQDFIPFLFNDETGEVRDVESYCQDIEHTAMWGGEVEIIALARAYKVNVELIQMKGPPLKINYEPNSQSPLDDKNAVKLSYYQHMYALGAHYNSLRDKISYDVDDI